MQQKETLMIEKKIVRFKELRKIIPLSRTSIYRKVKDGVFPKPIKLGTLAIGWLESDINEWIENKQKER